MRLGVTNYCAIKMITFAEKWNMNRSFFGMLFTASVLCAQQKLEIIDVQEATIDGASIRTLYSDGDRVWYGSRGGVMGYYDFREQFQVVKQITFGEHKPDFRSVSATNSAVFALSAGSPGLLYKIDKATATVKSVYRNLDKDIFFDGMHFFDDSCGIAFSDPVNGRFGMIRTTDGGQAWVPVSASGLDSANGEAAFAASNSTLVVHGSKAWIFSGGTTSRVFVSDNRGDSWKAFTLPGIQGTSMSGVFSVDFYDDNIGIAVGGDYERPELNRGNKMVTKDGGKSWTLVADGEAFGYASCVAFVPDGKGAYIVSVGPSGVWHTADTGQTWTKIMEDGDLYVIVFAGPDIAYAAGRNKIIRIQFR